jgi:hypothetical protein
MENASIYQGVFLFYEMINTSFLDKIAQVLIENYSDNYQYEWFYQIKS